MRRQRPWFIRRNVAIQTKVILKMVSIRVVGIKGMLYLFIIISIKFYFKLITYQ